MLATGRGTALKPWSTPGSALRRPANDFNIYRPEEKERILRSCVMARRCSDAGVAAQLD